MVGAPSLAEVLKQRALTPVQSINVTLKLLDVLSAAHGELTPENILVVGSLDGDLSIEVPGNAVQPSSADDVYAVGELLCRMLTRRPPPLIELAPELAGGAKLASLIRACLAQDPTKRPAIPLLASALRDVLAQQLSLDDSPPTAIALAPIPKQVMFEDSTVSNISPPLPVPPEPQAPRSHTLVIALCFVTLIVAAVVGGVVLVRETEPIVILPSEPEPQPKDEQIPPEERTIEPVDEVPPAKKKRPK